MMSRHVFFFLFDPASFIFVWDWIGQMSRPRCLQDNILEQFEQRQKQMEQENAKRKSLLTKAIADRKKRTEAEAQKLIKIQKELNHLDSLLSVDVSILRNQIEIASMEFTEAQKRYQKAEKEFVVAKLELFQKMQQKEKLTEHLCTIIEQNEARKAQKLVELMQQLEMDSLIETNINGVGNVLPQLCALNNIDYSLCTTIKPPYVGNIDNAAENNSHDDDNSTDEKNSSQCEMSSNETLEEIKCDNCETNTNKLETLSNTEDVNSNDITE
ncbi:RAB6-interacting golgin-like [Centruroides sculpturatus]|uniref:RAB6-interacting golgin-like n=1 Tax=Centruroides sculpturatus TaxID=218467 RepID=UPI000C6DDE1C|nr:RAB6-interacting golgin-like [Centruroides sculpturatus]